MNIRNQRNAGCQEDFVVRNISKIDIVAPIATVWRALTEADFVKLWQYGSELHTSWVVGSEIRFRTLWQEKVFEQWGTVLEFRPPLLLRYSLFAPRDSLEDKAENYFTMIYQLEQQSGFVSLEIIQQDNRAGAVQEEPQAEENPVLAALKKLAESMDPGQ
jgi:uncharacterized protein YndB with AHSA1/START domain